MANKFNLDGFSVSEENVCTADGGFVGTDIFQQSQVGIVTASGTLDPSKEVIVTALTASGLLVLPAPSVLNKRIKIICTVITGTTTITPSALAGGTSITFNAVGDTVELLYMSSSWYITGGNSYTIVG